MGQGILDSAMQEPETVNEVPKPPLQTSVLNDCSLPGSEAATVCPQAGGLPGSGPAHTQQRSDTSTAVSSPPACRSPAAGPGSPSAPGVLSPSGHELQWLPLAGPGGLEVQMSGRSLCSEVARILTLSPDVAPNTHPTAQPYPGTSPPRGLPHLRALTLTSLY